MRRVDVRLARPTTPWERIWRVAPTADAASVAVCDEPLADEWPCCTVCETPWFAPSAVGVPGARRVRAGRAVGTASSALRRRSARARSRCRGCRRPTGWSPVGVRSSTARRWCPSVCVNDVPAVWDGRRARRWTRRRWCRSARAWCPCLSPNDVPRPSGRATPADTPRLPCWSERTADSLWEMLRHASGHVLRRQREVTRDSMNDLSPMPRMNVSELVVACSRRRCGCRRGWRRSRAAVPCGIGRPRAMAMWPTRPGSGRAARPARR